MMLELWQKLVIYGLLAIGFFAFFDVVRTLRRGWQAGDTLYHFGLLSLSAIIVWALKYG